MNKQLIIEGLHLSGDYIKVGIPGMFKKVIIDGIQVFSIWISLELMTESEAKEIVHNTNKYLKGKDLHYVLPYDNKTIKKARAITFVTKAKDLNYHNGFCF